MRRVAALFWVAATMACANGPQEKPADLGASRQSLARANANLENYVVQLRSAIDEVSVSYSFVAEIEAGRLAPPFPLDAFKHALVSCLNVFEVTSSVPEIAEIAKRYDVVCAVPALRVLDLQLEGDSQRRFAIDVLRKIDLVRYNRAVAQKLLRDLPDQLARTSAFVAAQKSELRRTREQTRRRKADFDLRDFEDAMDAMDAFENELDGLAARVADVERQRAEWTQELGNTVDDLYKTVTVLGGRDG